MSNSRKNFLAKGFSLNFRTLTFSLNMKTKSMACQEEVLCTILSQVFPYRQYAIFLKALKEGQLSVQAETFYSNKLASGTVGLLLSRKLSRWELRDCPRTSEPNHLFVLVRVSNPTRKLAYLVRSERVRSYLQMESLRTSDTHPLF